MDDDFLHAFFSLRKKSVTFPHDRRDRMVFKLFELEEIIGSNVRKQLKTVNIGCTSLINWNSLSKQRQKLDEILEIFSKYIISP